MIISAALLITFTPSLHDRGFWTLSLEYEHQFV